MSDSAAPAPDLSWEEHVVLSRVTHGVDDRQASYDALTVLLLQQMGLVAVDDHRLVPTDLGRALAAPEGRHR